MAKAKTKYNLRLRIPPRLMGQLYKVYLQVRVYMCLRRGLLLTVESLDPTQNAQSPFLSHRASQTTRNFSPLEKIKQRFLSHGAPGRVESRGAILKTGALSEHTHPGFKPWPCPLTPSYFPHQVPRGWQDLGVLPWRA